MGFRKEMKMNCKGRTARLVMSVALVVTVTLMLLGLFCVPAAAEMTVDSIDPTEGEQGETVDMTITGTELDAVVDILLMKTGESSIVGTDLNVQPTKVECVLEIPSDAALGVWSILAVRNILVGGAGENTYGVINQTVIGQFTIYAPGGGPPEITSISPTCGGVKTELQINGKNFGDTRGTSYASFGSVAATEYQSWSSTQIKCTVPMLDTGDYEVTVTTESGTSNSKTYAVTFPDWYLAEGTTAWGYNCYISIENPNDTAATARVTYMTSEGPVQRPDIQLPPLSQTTVDPRSDIGEADFSTHVECLEGLTLAVDRTMYWTGEGAPSPDGHCSIGVTAPDRTWYLAEGSSEWGFECWLLIQNPNEQKATATVTYMIEGAPAETFTKEIPANSRRTYNMAEDIGARDSSIKVEADIPVIPERAVYRNNRREGHDSIGTTAPATTYYLAEGTTAWGFTTYVLVQNPQETETDVNMTYMTPEGPVQHPENPIKMPANSRKTVRINDFQPEIDLSTMVTGSQPIIAERAMYWGEGSALGEACHDSIGLAEPHPTFFLPDGQTSEGRETWTLVQNPNETDVTVEISYLTPDGTGIAVFEEDIPANSRKTFSMAEKIGDGRASVLVECKTEGKKIIAERAMYWNNRGAGTDTVGGYSD